MKETVGGARVEAGSQFNASSGMQDSHRDENAIPG